MPYKRKGVYYTDCYISGKRIRESLGPTGTRKQAKAREAEILRVKRRSSHRTIGEALARWLEGDASRLKSFIETRDHATSLEPYQKMPLTEAAGVAELIKQDMRHLKPATINRRLSLLRRVCNLAVEWGWIELAPRFRLLPVNNERHIYLSPEDVERLAQECANVHVGDIVRFAAYTGLRRGEIFSDWKLDGDYLILSGQTKSGRPRIVPVPEEIRGIAERMPLPVSVYQVDKGFVVARKALGMTCRFHDLRHTYASWLIQAGAGLPAVMLLMGHSTLAVTARYAHLDPGHLREAVDKMTARLNEK